MRLQWRCGWGHSLETWQGLAWKTPFYRGSLTWPEQWLLVRGLLSARCWSFCRVAHNRGLLSRRVGDPRGQCPSCSNCGSHTGSFQQYLYTGQPCWMREKSRKCVLGTILEAVKHIIIHFWVKKWHQKWRNSQMFKKSALHIDFLRGRDCICRHAFFTPDIPFFLF